MNELTAQAQGIGPREALNEDGLCGMIREHLEDFQDVDCQQDDEPSARAVGEHGTGVLEGSLAVYASEDRSHADEALQGGVRGCSPALVNISSSSNCDYVKAAGVTANGLEAFGDSPLKARNSFSGHGVIFVDDVSAPRTRDGPDTALDHGDHFRRVAARAHDKYEKAAVTEVVRRTTGDAPEGHDFVVTCLEAIRMARIDGSRRRYIPPCSWEDRRTGRRPREAWR